MECGLAQGLKGILPAQAGKIRQQTLFEAGDVAPALFFVVRHERDEIGGGAVGGGELAADRVELVGDAEGEGEGPIRAGHGKKGRKIGMVAGEPPGEDTEDEDIGCGICRQGQEVFGSDNGAREDGGPLFRGKTGQFGA